MLLLMLLLLLILPNCGCGSYWVATIVYTKSSASALVATSTASVEVLASTIAAVVSACFAEKEIARLPAQSVRPAAQLFRSKR